MRCTERHTNGLGLSMFRPRPHYYPDLKTLTQSPVLVILVEPQRLHTPSENSDATDAEEVKLRHSLEFVRRSTSISGRTTCW